MKGVKHLIQCHCILPQYKAMTNPVFHKFTVFSVIDNSDTVVTKYTSCNNCGATHRIYDLCKSEIVTGKEDAKSQMSISDFKFSLPSDLFELLNHYGRDISDFEYSQFIVDNKKWDTSIILSREEIEGRVQGKMVRFVGPEKFRIESYLHKDTIDD